VEVFRSSAGIALVVGFAASTLIAFTGHAQAQLVAKQQPMKIAAAEALWDTKTKAEFSLFAIGDVANGHNYVNIAIPGALSILARNDPNATVEGMNDLNANYAAKYGPGDYRPPVAVSYWSFRIMVGIGLVLMLFTFIGLVLLRRHTLSKTRWFLRLAPVLMIGPYLANSVGWIFTEVGRQPWSVFGVLQTRDSVSKIVATGEVLTTLIGFTLAYGVLAVIWARLTVRYAKAGPLDVGEESELHAAMAY
jgi:cytochrome d ubiquinol oxidase subunit I